MTPLRPVESRQLPLRFDSARMAAELEGFGAADWTAHFVHDNYEGEWSVVPLRAARGATHPLRMIYADPGCTDFVDTPYLARCPYLRQVLATFLCPLRSARLMRLAAGSRIKEHCDPGLDIDHATVRLHVPVTTNPDVEFHVNGVRVDMAAGTAWYLRLTDPHRVVNRGPSDRIHLVIDAELNAWLAGMLAPCISAEESDLRERS